MNNDTLTPQEQSATGIARDGSVRHVSDEEMTQAIMGGITFKGAKLRNAPKEEKVRTKAKKKTYITGTHGSASAKHKADIRKRRANRHKK